MRAGTPTSVRSHHLVLTPTLSGRALLIIQSNPENWASTKDRYYSQQSLPELRDVHKRYKDKLEIVKISEDVNKDIWEKSIKQDSITWMNLWDGKGEYGDAVLKYGTIGTPNYILISPGKIIVEKWFGYSSGTIQEKLKTHL